MKTSSQLLTLTISAAVVIACVPFTALATGGDHYADAVSQASNQTYQPDQALGAPDQSYAQFLSKDASVILDMGADEEGTGDLTLYYNLLNFGATYRVEFMDDAMEKVQTSSAVLPLYQSATTIAYTAGVPYRYVSITSTESEIWKLDAIESATVSEAPAATEPPPTEMPPTQTPTEQPTEAPAGSLAQGLLVKLVDDGNPNTTVDAAVYEIGADGMRHAFPSPTVYNSWWKDFSDVAFIDASNLASYQLGANVTIRPGTNLVKIVSDPKVYAVEPGGVLRWIQSEDIAKALYGSQWAKRVVDVPDTAFANYAKGDDITAAVYPTGTLGVLPSGEVVYFERGTYHGIPGDVFEAMRFNSDDLVSVTPDTLGLYVDGGSLTNDPSIGYPY